MPRKPIDVLDRRARVLPFYAKGNHVFGSTAVSPVADGGEVVAPFEGASGLWIDGGVLNGAPPKGCRAPTFVRLDKSTFGHGNCDSTGDHDVIQKADLDEVESSFELSGDLLIGYRRLGYTARVWMGRDQGRSIF